MNMVLRGLVDQWKHANKQQSPVRSKVMAGILVKLLEHKKDALFVKFHLILSICLHRFDNVFLMF